MVEVLLRRGARTDIRDSSGRLARDIDSEWFDMIRSRGRTARRRELESLREEVARLETIAAGLESEEASLGKRRGAEESAATAPVGGERWNEFINAKRLGRGGYGTVYRVQWKKNHSYYALKVIGKRGKGKVPLRREMDVMKELCHRNAVQLVDSWEDDTSYYLLEELCTKGTLQEALVDAERRVSDGEDNPFEKGNILRGFLADMISVLSYLEGQNILHMDIKSENILVTQSAGEEDGGRLVPKIADFGMATVGRSTMVTHRGGTPMYMAPELMRGKRADFRADVFSMGVVMHQLVTLRMPWPEDLDAASARHTATPGADLKKLLAWVDGGHRLALPEGILAHDTYLRGVINRMLAVDPDSRPLASVLDAELKRNRIVAGKIAYSVR